MRLAAVMLASDGFGELASSTDEDEGDATSQRWAISLRTTCARFKCASTVAWFRTLAVMTRRHIFAFHSGVHSSWRRRSSVFVAR